MKVFIMSVSQLLLEHLHQLDDGLLAAAFEANVLEIVRDLEDRPADDRARTLTLTLTLTVTNATLTLTITKVTLT